MKITEETPYPTIGEVLLTVFKWSGLWGYLGEQDGLKTLQKKLQRFATEETLLTHDEIEDLICKSLGSATPHHTLGLIVARSFVLLMDGYRQVMRGNATWLDRKQTMQWFIRGQFVMPLVLNLKRAQMIFRQEHDPEHIYHFPEEPFWFLPDKSNGKWPLREVMKWWQSANKIESWEHLGGVHAPTFRNWLNGTEPTIGSLKEIEKARLGLHYDEANMKRSLTLCCMISNLANNFLETMCGLVGETEVERFLADFKLLYNALDQNETKEFQRWVAPEIEKGRQRGAISNYPEEEKMAGEFLALKDWEDIFHSKILFPRILDVFSVVEQTESTNCLQKDNFVCEAGRHHWKSQQDVIERHFDDETKSLLYDAEQLRMKIVKGEPEAWVSAQASLPAFRRRCEQHGSGWGFCPEYLDARLATYSGAYEEALGYYHRAFRICRYRGGGVMKNCAEEYLILGSYLYTHKGKFGIKVSKNLLNYLHKWISLLYPVSEWAKTSGTDYIEFAASKFHTA
jgi:hypothetical protein